MSAVRLDKNVEILTRDGTRLSGDIYRPASGAKVPVVLIYGPYRKDDLAIAAEAGLERFLVDTGYALALVDARGTGASAGTRTEFWSAHEIEDGYDTVEWLGEQPWCTGAVGMTGKSYLSKSLLLVSSMNPPHLRATVALCGAGDTYDLFYPGGNMRYMMMSYVSAFMIALDFAPPAYQDSKGRWTEVWREHLEGNNPPFLKEIEEQSRSARHEANSSYSAGPKIRVPTYFVSGWHDSVPSEVLRTYNSIGPGVPKKVVIGPWAHYRPDLGVPGPKIDFLSEYERWFGRWLKGVRNKVEREPRVTVYARKYDQPVEYRDEDHGEWWCGEDWPPRGSTEVRLYLGGDGELCESPRGCGEAGGRDTLLHGEVTGTSSGIWPGMGWVCLPGDQRADESTSLTYTTEPYPKNTEITGAPRVELFVSSTAEVATFSVKLNDVSPDGRSAQITKGIMNATRAIGRVPTPMKANRIYALEFPLKDLSYVLPAGHRLRLTVGDSDFPEVWPIYRDGSFSIHRDESHRSALVIPTLKRRRRPVRFEPPRAWPTSTTSSGGLNRWSVGRDLIGNRNFVKLETKDEYTIDDWNKGRSRSGLEASISRSCPSEGLSEAFYRWTMETRNKVEIESNVRITSDEASFQAFASVNIKLNGAQYFAKSWSKSVGRFLL